MSQDQVRFSPLAKVKALSLSALITSLTQKKEAANQVNTLDKLGGVLSPGAMLNSFLDAFVDVGLARDIRIDEDWGTQAVYGIGNPTKPLLVPNNYSVNLSITRLQMDRRDNFSYLTSPDYWYNSQIQKALATAGDIGMEYKDWALYSYVFVPSKESGGHTDIYAVMPRTASRGIQATDIFIAHSVTCIGFKVTYNSILDLVDDLLDDGVLFNNTGTTEVTS